MNKKYFPWSKLPAQIFLFFHVVKHLLALVQQLKHRVWLMFLSDQTFNFEGFKTAFQPWFQALQSFLIIRTVNTFTCTQVTRLSHFLIFHVNLVSVISTGGCPQVDEHVTLVTLWLSAEWGWKIITRSDTLNKVQRHVKQHKVPCRRLNKYFFNTDSWLDLLRRRKIKDPLRMVLLRSSLNKYQSTLSSAVFCLSAVSERAALLMALCMPHVTTWMLTKAPQAAHSQFLLIQLWGFILCRQQKTQNNDLGNVREL